MELGPVVITDQAGHMLEGLRLELNLRGSAVAVRLLTSCNHGLSEEAAQRFAAIHTQVPWAFIQAEEFFRPRGSQPLKVQWKLRPVEILPRWNFGKHMGR